MLRPYLWPQRKYLGKDHKDKRDIGDNEDEKDDGG